MNWLRYLLEANLYLGVFYLAYCLFLNKETFYRLNRIYLLSVCIISFILPVTQLGVLKPAEITGPAAAAATYVAPLHSVAPAIKMAEPPVNYFSLEYCMIYTYLLGVVILVLWFAARLYQLLKLTRAKTTILYQQYKLVYINNSGSAFSFFNYLFIGTQVNGAETIIRHELVHIRQKHSVDIILVEVIKIISWFNPFVYLLQISLKAVHEYIADENTTQVGNDALSYSAFLVNNAYGIGGPPLTHSFSNYNLLKKRIIMLNQKRSGNLARLKYLLTVPVCAVLLCVSTLGFSKTYGLIDLAPRKIDTPLIPPPTPPMPPQTKPPVLFKLPSPFASITKKGYRYAESAYLVNGKSNFRVIIQESKNVQKEYWKNKVSPAEVKMLHDKYGYTFPSIPIYPKMPPAPPQPPVPGAAVVPQKLPPPIVKPAEISEPGLPANQPTPPAPPIPPKEASADTNEHLFLHNLGNIIEGPAPEMEKPYFAQKFLRHPQLVYIQLDKVQMDNVVPYTPIVYGENAVYMINGKIYTQQDLEKRSAAISTRDHIKTLFAAEKAIYHKPNNQTDIAKYGPIVKDGMTEFVNVRSSNL